MSKTNDKMISRSQAERVLFDMLEEMGALRTNTISPKTGEFMYEMPTGELMRVSSTVSRYVTIQRVWVGRSGRALFASSYTNFVSKVLSWLEDEIGWEAVAEHFTPATQYHASYSLDFDNLSLTRRLTWGNVQLPVSDKEVQEMFKTL